MGNLCGIGMVMNSKQRRQHERRYPYTVRLMAPNHLRYFEWDERVDEMRVWCKKYARKGWTVKALWDGSEFSFAQEQNLTWFLLKWA